jgi:hypothetical protein
MDRNKEINNKKKFQRAMEMYLPKGWEKCLTFTGKLFLGVVKGN